MEATRELAILIVSTNVSDVTLIKRSLATVGAFTVYVAGTGQKALASAAKEEFAAIIIDAELPDSPGLVALRQLVQRGYVGPIIMLTAQFEKGLAAEAVAAGAYEVLPKVENFWVAVPKLILRGLERAKLVARIKELETAVNLLEQMVSRLTEASHQEGEDSSITSLQAARRRRRRTS